MNLTWLRSLSLPLVLAGAVIGPGMPAHAQSGQGAASCEELQKQYPGLVGREVVVGISPAPANYSATDPNDPSSIIGIEPDLLKVAGDCLGFTFSYSKLDFAGLIPALQAGRIHLIAAGMYSSAERAKQVDFVEYMKAGEASLVQAGNPKGLTSLENVCGVIAAQVVGTVENEILAKQSASCEAAGKEPIEPLQFQSIDRAYSALGQGRADILLTDAGVASFLAAQAPDRVAVGFAITTDFVFGFGINKEDKELLEGLHAALQKQEADGTMKEALTRWGFAPEQAHEPSIKTE
jgi:polar amino acid transport system substrate-binding protein